jgi:predicted Zn-ribbon and HTH transcriptional regulator
LIDANAVDYENIMCSQSQLHWLNAIIEKQPTIDAVEVVHGHWKYGTRAAVCSECGFERSLDDNFGAAIACPNCGAKMDGDGNG